MNAETTRYFQQARRFSHFVHQTMRDRGMQCAQNEIEQAMVELSPAQLVQLHARACDVAKGADSHDALAALAALRRISSRATRQALAQAQIRYRADVLLPLATDAATATTFTRELAALCRADLPGEQRQAAAAQLLTMCGSLTHDDLLHEPQPSAAQPEPPSPAAQTEHTPPAAPQPPARARRASARAPRMQVKVYGKSAALTWEAAPARAPAASDEESTLATVMIEGAKALGDGSFDWSAKIIFACAQRELPQLLAVLLGWHDVVEFNFHGGKADKSLRLQHQDRGLFVKLRDGQRAVAVPVSDPDRYELAMLVLNVMASNDPCGSVEAVLAVCRDVMRPASNAVAGASLASGAAGQR